MPTEPKRETLYYRVRGGFTGDKGVSNECRALRGVTHLRDRGFRTFRNGREPLNNTHDSKVMDLMSFVNAVLPQAKEMPVWMHNLGGMKAHLTVASHVASHFVTHTHDSSRDPSWSFTVGRDGEVEPQDFGQDSFNEFIARWGRNTHHGKPRTGTP